MSRPERPSWLPWAAVVTAVVFWGGSYPAMKVMLRVLDPWAVMWGRMGLAVLVMAPLWRRLDPRGPYQAGDWRWLAPLVICMPCLYFWLEANAINYTTSAQAGLISASVPLMVGVGAWLVFGERLSRQAVLGLLISLVGVGWLTLAGSPDQNAPHPWLGNLMELLAMAVAATGMLILKGLSRRWSSWTLTALQTLTGAIFFLPGAGEVLRLLAGGPSPTVLLALVFLGVFVTLGAFGLYNWGLSQLGAGQAAAFINLVPVVAVSLGWALLGETLNGWQMLAAGLVLGGVLLSQSRPPRVRSRVAESI